VICTSLGFQKSVLKYAQSKGLGLCRLSPEADIVWDQPRRDTNYNRLDTIPGLVEEILVSSQKKICRGFYVCMLDGNYCYSLQDFAKVFLYARIAPISGNRNIHHDIPYLSQDEISRRVDELRERLGVMVSTTYRETFENIVVMFGRDISIVDNCDLGLDTFGNRIIGNTGDGYIEIYDKINFNDSRVNFTVAHEIGHSVLHQGQEWYQYYSDMKRDIDFGQNETSGRDDASKRMEYQANYFASELLIPDSTIRQIMPEIIEEERLIDKGYGVIYLDHQKINQQLFNRVAQKLQTHVSASKLAIQIKLEKLGYLKRGYRTNKELVEESIRAMLGLADDPKDPERPSA